MNIKIEKSSHPRYSWELSAPKKMFGKRIREFHKTKADAERSKSALMKKWDVQNTPVDPKFAAVTARYQDEMTLEQFEDAMRDKIQHLKQTNRTFDDVQNEFVTELKRLHERKVHGKRYWKDHKNGLARLAQKLKKSPKDDGPLLRDINKAMLDDFYDNELDQGYSPRTIKNYIDYLSALFIWATKKGYVTKNPARDIRLASYKPEVHILKPDEIQTLLNHACWYTKCWILFGAFGGARSSEIGYLRWEDIRMEQNEFYIPGRKNVGAERWVKITPPLRAFLEEALADGPRRGLIMNGMHTGQGHFQRMFESLYERAGFRIPKNALRHSYGSHHLRAHNTSYLTAAEMGHVSPKTTYTHYRKAVTTQQAEEYWEVRTTTKCFSKNDPPEEIKKAA